MLCVPSFLCAQNIHPTPPPEVRAVPLEGEIHLDGRLDEPIWKTAPVATDFLQNQPHQGEPATQRTEVRFVFDAAAIYVGARMYDDSGSRGVRTRLARRDADISTDYIQVIFDTYHDHIGRLFFLVNPSGVKQDANGLGGGGDPSWDPVWEVQTSIDSLGWTAEMRIPFSQLRYPSTSQEQTWGLQIWRQENRLNELSQWSYWKPEEVGGPPRFGHLHGLVIHQAPGRAELLPYVVGRSSSVPGDPADPFYDPHAMDGRVGADAMLRVTSNLTLNATVNPDFGQVEVDPAVVNLGTFETFFPEKRPFFVEGAGYFGLGGFSCYFCSNAFSLSMLNTRRIGRAPQLPAVRDSVAYADAPDNTRIIGAAKLTGRTPSGWSIGVLNALTNHEEAPVALPDSARAVRTVEPLTNYFVGRVAKDFRGGATVLKIMGTSVRRDLGNDPYVVQRLSQHSEALGAGTEMWWSKRTYRLMAQLAGTQVIGDTGAIRRVKESQRHFFQRPDRSDTLDVRKPWTSMYGLGGFARVSREQGHLLWEVSTNFRTRSFDNNDITILPQGDFVWMSANLFPLWTKPTKWYRQLVLIGGAQQQYNLDGDLTNRDYHLFGQMQSLGYWSFSTFWIGSPGVLDDRLTRGGPVVGRPGRDYFSVDVRSDNRKAVVGELTLDGGCNRDGDCQRDASLSLELKPKSNVSLSLGPSVNVSHSGVQAVGTYQSTIGTGLYGVHYVFGQLERNEVAMDTRLNVTFSPTLTLELYMQPFISAGDYTSYNEFAATRTTKRLTYGRDMGTIVVTPPASPGGSNTITLDSDGPGGDTTFTFTDPSFTFRSLRGNAVLRWEYRPGSTLFLVWTRSGATQESRGQINWNEDTSALFQGPSENIFMVKVNYWLGF